MSYEFACPFCRTPITVESLGPGEPIPCATCGKVVAVPPGAPAPTRAKAHGHAPKPPAAGAGGRRWAPFRRLAPVFTLLGVLNLLIGIPLGIIIITDAFVLGLYVLLVSIVWAFICFGLACWVDLLLSMKKDLEELKQR